MPFRYLGNLRALDRQVLFGRGECVDIIKELVPGLIGISTQTWKEGAMVKDSPSLKPDKPVSDWVMAVPGQMHLKGAGMMAGKPETKTYLVPDNGTKTAQTFRFFKGEERWLFCDYGAVELSRRVRDGATSCTITFKTKKPGKNLSAVVVCN